MRTAPLITSIVFKRYHGLERIAPGRLPNFVLGCYIQHRRWCGEPQNETQKRRSYVLRSRRLVSDMFICAGLVGALEIEVEWILGNWRSSTWDTIRTMPALADVVNDTIEYPLVLPNSLPFCSLSVFKYGCMEADAVDTRKELICVWGASLRGFHHVVRHPLALTHNTRVHVMRL
jgi:hypothetical protein